MTDLKKGLTFFVDALSFITSSFITLSFVTVAPRAKSLTRLSVNAVLCCLPLCVSTTNAAEPLLNTLQTEQVVLVTAKEWGSTTGTLAAFERVQGAWKRTEIHGAANLGRTGLSWGEGLQPKQSGPQKNEGDGKSPAGVFEFGIAFGDQLNLTTKMPYEQMTDTHFCIDVDGSPLYNQIVDRSTVGEAAVAGSTEPMRLDLVKKGDRQYAKGLVILSNPKNLPGKGSCIFMHLWPKKGAVTLGCTALDEKVLDALLRWLDPKKRPVFVLLPQAQYDAKQKEWGLPALRKGI